MDVGYCLAMLRFFNRRVSPWSRAQRPAKHIDKRTDVVVAELESNCRHGNPIRNKFECAKQARLLTPFRESHTRLDHETTAQRSRREAGPCGPLFEAAVVRQIAGQGVRDRD